MLAPKLNCLGDFHEAYSQYFLNLSLAFVITRPLLVRRPPHSKPNQSISASGSSILNRHSNNAGGTISASVKVLPGEGAGLPCQAKDHEQMLAAYKANPSIGGQIPSGL